MQRIADPDKSKETGEKGENRTFRRLLRASLISTLGSHVTTIAYPLLVLRMTGSPFTAGCVAFAATAPGVLVHMPAGALVDRWDPRRSLLLSEFGRGVAILTVTLSVALGNAAVALLIAVAVIEGILEVFSGLAELRYFGLLLQHSSEVGHAPVSSIEVSAHLAVVAGRPLGGLLFEIGPIFPFLVDVMSFVYSVASISRLNTKTKLNATTISSSSQSVQKSSLIPDIRQGVRRIKEDNYARIAIISFSIGTLMFQALIIVLLSDARSRGLSALAIGLVLATSGAGGAAGSALAPRLLAKARRPWIQTQMRIWTAGFALLIFSVGRNFLVSAIIMAILGFTGALGNIELTTCLMRGAEGEMLARVTSVSRLVTLSATASGPLLGGILVQELGVQHAMACLFLFAPVLLLLSARTPPATGLPDGPHVRRATACDA
jgi:predicted MFS family arabinose efflux permease